MWSPPWRALSFGGRCLMHFRSAARAVLSPHATAAGQPRWSSTATSVPPERERLLMAKPQGAYREALGRWASGAQAPLLLPAEDFLCLDTFKDSLETCRVPIRREGHHMGEGERTCTQ